MGPRGGINNFENFLPLSRITTISDFKISSLNCFYLYAGPTAANKGEKRYSVNCYHLEMSFLLLYQNLVSRLVKRPPSAV